MYTCKKLFLIFELILLSFYYLLPRSSQAKHVWYKLINCRWIWEGKVLSNQNVHVICFFCPFAAAKESRAHTHTSIHNHIPFFPWQWTLKKYNGYVCSQFQCVHSFVNLHFVSSKRKTFVFIIFTFLSN